MKYYLYHNWIHESDLRTRQYWLTRGGPLSVLTFMTLWLLFVTKIGPKLMANRKPFSLRWLMFAYNILMTVTNAYFFVMFLKLMDYQLLTDFQFPSREDTSPHIMRCIDVGMVYGYTKYVDLLDTVFLVLRKKESHLTFLHLYHHFMVPIFGWLGAKVAPTCPPAAIFALLNTPVHTMMYSYYALSALGPTVHRFLWWKRYITVAQILQFVLFLSYAIISAFLSTGYPSVLYWFAWIQSPIFLYMFVNFYRKSYGKTNKMNKDL